jgi:hypothetical protein
MIRREWIDELGILEIILYQTNAGENYFAGVCDLAFMAWHRALSATY